MLGVDASEKPPSASDSSHSVEASRLDLHLQRQLEEDIARLFDESIYSDVEVVCGKLKILTHSCILQARTNKFYNKLETILRFKIGRSSFDEIYSFISDTYTECDIKRQEKEILDYINSYTKEEKDVFMNPQCVSPYIDKSLKRSVSSSPSTELTKEYYALVPIENNLLEKELKEQEALSSAFRSIINSQVGNISKFDNPQHSKPTSLTLYSSHTSKSVHSKGSDILNITHHSSNSLTESDKYNDKKQKYLKSCEFAPDKTIETTYSPDSLITDDPSSASDYLSAAYTCSPEISSNFSTHLMAEDNTTKMEMKMFTSSDSGLENTGLLESLTSHKDVTLTDVSLTESAIQDLTIEDNPQCSTSISNIPVVDKIHSSAVKSDSLIKTIHHSNKISPENHYITPLAGKHKDVNNSTKEEKQRQNEEIVILESSSLSSETGSWESVFPPKLTPKDICVNFIHNERMHNHESNQNEKETTNQRGFVTPNHVQKSSFKSTSCFIDAASLADEEDTSIKVNYAENIVAKFNASLPVPSNPVPCTTNKLDLSPNDWSENDNDDSLDTDSIQKDLSPTIFETEIGSGPTNINNQKAEEKSHIDTSYSKPQKSVMVSSTPYNSIMFLKSSSFKQYESEESENDSSIIARKPQASLNNVKTLNESSPVIVSYSPSPKIRRKFDCKYIASEAYDPPSEHDTKSSSSFVTTMSTISMQETEISFSAVSHQRPIDKACESLKNSNKSSVSEYCSKSSVDSDSCERSSQKFYVDLSSLPDVEPPKTMSETESASEKKNMFSMFIDFGENSALKEMPSRLTPLSTKKNTAIEIKQSPRNQTFKNNNDSRNSTKQCYDLGRSSVFEMCEDLCENPNISVSEILCIHKKYHKESELKNDKEERTKGYDQLKSGDKSLHRSLRTTIREEEINEEEDELFVKLSDLDKPSSIIDTSEGNHYDKMLDERMTRSIPENNWGDPTRARASRSNEVISSFHSENALSLNRLFPHLRNEFSRSMPGSLSSRTRSTLRLGASTSSGDIDDQVSETSEMSSVQSSFCRSIVEHSTTEETSQASSLIGNCQSRLGQDLLRMFLEEIAPDVIVEVSGRRIKAHKCILSSRCQYFAGILSGGWVESAGNVISLPTFSFNVVHFALCHIYSGVSTIPDSISILELATLADMLGLEGLKEAIMFTLKAKYCHHFHRPCAVCKAGVLECFPLTSVYGLDDLYRKCLKWITKYFSKVWPTKAFATLPSDLIEKCYQQVVIDMSLDNCVETAYGCGLAVSALKSSRWAEVVARMCDRLARATANFMASKLVTVLQNTGNLPPRLPMCAVHALDECVKAAIVSAPPEQLCRAYDFIANNIKEIYNCNKYSTKPDHISNTDASNPSIFVSTHATAWLALCEKSIVRDASRVCCTQAYADLPPELRKRLQDLGCISRPAIFSDQILHTRRSRSKPAKSHNSVKPPVVDNLDIDQMRASFVPYSLKPAPQDTFRNNVHLQEYRKTTRVPPKVRTTKAQEERAKFNLTKSTLSQERLHSKSVGKAYDNPKSRYLEQRMSQEINRKMSIPKVISSSQSSISQARNFKTTSMKIQHVDEEQIEASSYDDLPELRPDPEVFKDSLVANTHSRREVQLQAFSRDSLATSSRSRSQTQAITHDSLINSSRPRNDSQIDPVPRNSTTTTRDISSRSRSKAKVHTLSQDSLVSRPRTAEPSTDSLSESQSSNKYATYTKSKHTSKGSTNSSKTSTQSQTYVVNGKVRSRIPVYLNRNTKGPNLTDNTQKRRSHTLKTSATSSNTSSSVPSRTKIYDKNSCSLMNATKSSSAKMVTKVVKESKDAKIHSKSKGISKHQQRFDNEPTIEIPVMERSGTFLKDEPTFGDKSFLINADLNRD